MAILVLRAALSMPAPDASRYSADAENSLSVPTSHLAIMTSRDPPRFLGSTAGDPTEMPNLCPACDPQALTDQSPQRLIYLDEYWIDRTEVTNAMFAKFVAETGHVTTAEREGKSYVVDTIRRAFGIVDGADWRHPTGLASSTDEQGSYPVRQVSWDAAAAYCTWAGQRPPSEAEWEKARAGRMAACSRGATPPGEQLLNSDIMGVGGPVASVVTGHALLDRPLAVWKPLAVITSLPFGCSSTSQPDFCDVMPQPIYSTPVKSGLTLEDGGQFSTAFGPATAAFRGLAAGRSRLGEPAFSRFCFVV